MATFSLKKYASKIYTYDLYNELFKKHKVTAFFEISDSVPRKAALDIILETFKGLDIGKRIDIEKELSYVNSFSTEHAARIYSSLISDELGASFEPEIECSSPQDIVLYCYLRHPDLLDRVLFLHDFYMSKSYTMYEAENKNISFDDKKAELEKDWDRLANKDDNPTDCTFASEELDDVLYFSATFEGRYQIEEAIDRENGTLDRTRTKRRVERVFVAYVKKEERVLIRGTVGRVALTHFLDSFLRIVCDVQYEGKKESFTLDSFKNLGFDFVSINKGTPLLRWKIKAIALSYANGKKKLRLALPSEQHTAALAPLSETLDELGMMSKYESFTIDSVSLTMVFQDKKNENKSKNVNISLSPRKCGLCPLFEEHNYARKFLKLANIDQGFMLEEK